jgi:hypothetical protein
MNNSPSQKYFKTRGVIGGWKTPWTGDTTNQALVACKNQRDTVEL